MTSAEAAFDAACLALRAAERALIRGTSGRADRARATWRTAGLAHEAAAAALRAEAFAAERAATVAGRLAAVAPRRAARLAATAAQPTLFA